MAKPHKLAVVGDDTLIALASKEVVTAQFPFLAELKGLGKRCGCKRQKGNGEASKITAAKVAIGQLSSQSRDVFKKMVNAEKVRLNYTDGAGRPQKIEF